MEGHGNATCVPVQQRTRLGAVRARRTAETGEVSRPTPRLDSSQLKQHLFAHVREVITDG